MPKIIWGLPSNMNLIFSFLSYYLTVEWTSLGILYVYALIKTTVVHLIELKDTTAQMTRTSLGSLHDLISANQSKKEVKCNG